jgi:CheY-like chemotaxis protein
MVRRVLLVDTDVDALGALASALRARGLQVANASDGFEAVEQAFQSRPDVVLVDGRLDDDQDLVRAFEVVPELADIPVLRLVRRDGMDQLGPDEVLRTDVDHVISRIALASPRVSHVTLDQELRGNIEQMPMVDLLQLLTMNRRSGVLGITTAHGAGEVRLNEGEVVDAVYRRLQGEKAFYRMLGERDGRFAFSPGTPAGARRLTSPTSQLLMEAMRQVDEVQHRRRELSAEALRFDDGPGPADLPADLPAERAAVARDLAGLLALPRSLDDLLDDHPATDLAVLEALAALDGSGRLRRVPLADLTTPFAPPEQLPVLRSLVTRLTRAGFAPPPRLVIAAGVRRMASLAHAIRRITDALAPSEQLPSASLPRPLGTLRLGDGVDLALTGLPVDDAFTPTWTLALPGAAAVVRLAGAGGRALSAHCEAVEVMLIDAETLTTSLDTTIPSHVAGLVRSALEMAAGV